MSEGKNRIYALGATPANAAAARLLFKSPWWAKCPGERRKIVSDVFKRLNPNDLCDVNKAPAGNLKDHRGYKYGKYIILGYSHSTDKGQRIKRKNNKKPNWYFGNDWDTTARGSEGRNDRSDPDNATSDPASE